jgi:predicted dinucleotide-binding enzyme
MRIGIIGAGNVGSALGHRLAAKGHDVVFGVREPERGGEAVKGGVPAHARVAGVTEAVRGSDAVILATPWGAVADALREAGAGRGDLDGVTLVDATNPLGPGFSLDVGPNGTSAAERIQALAPRAHVVKAFNTTGANNMQDPVYDGAPTVMFYAGDDADAKRTVHQLVADVGFEPVDAGPLTRARELEHFAMLWIALAMGVGVPALGREIAFRLVRR